jgi:hypothetical protein
MKTLNKILSIGTLGLATFLAGCDKSANIELVSGEVGGNKVRVVRKVVRGAVDI